MQTMLESLRGEIAFETRDEITECAYLGALVSGRPIGPRDPVQPDDFSSDLNRIMFRVVLAMQKQNVRVDRITLGQWLRNDPEASQKDWGSYVDYCTETPASYEDSPLFAEKIHIKAVRRRAAQQALEALARALDTNAPPPEEPAASSPLDGGMQLLTAADALAPQPPVEWIVEPLIGRGSLSIFYGDAGSKKTYSLLSMAVSAATGKDWLGFTTKHCSVLFVDEEAGRQRMTRRVRETLRGALADESARIKYACLSGFNVNDPLKMADLYLKIKANDIQLVIIDTLAAVTMGDENSKQEMQPLMTALRRLAEELNVAIVLIHHSGKNGTYRGSSAYKASVDLLVKVTSRDGSPFVSFKTEKVRDGEAMSWSARAVWVKEAEQFYMEAAPEQERPKEKAPGMGKQHVLRYLTVHGESSLPDIMSAADICTGDAARQAVYRLAHERLVRRTNPGEKGAGAVARYALGEAKSVDSGV